MEQASAALSAARMLELTVERRSSPLPHPFIGNRTGEGRSSLLCLSHSLSHRASRMSGREPCNTAPSSVVGNTDNDGPNIWRMKNMQEQMQNDALNGVGFLLAMLWVFGLMACVVVSYIGRRTNERKEQTYGYELEVIKTLHRDSRDANHSLANFLTKVRGRGGWKAYFEGYNHETRETTKIVTDGSLSGGGVEIVSPPLTGIKERRRWLSTVAGKLGGLVRPDRSCGVHVHIGLKKPDQNFGDEGVYTNDEARMIATKTMVLYTVFSRAFDEVLPRSRRNNNYASHHHDLLSHAVYEICNNNAEQTMALWAGSLYERAISDRYWSVNITSLRKYGTIEFRQHGGSTNPTKIDAWTQLCSAVVARAATIKHDEMKAVLSLHNGRWFSAKLEDLAHFLGLSMTGQLMTYFKRRSDELKGIPLDPKCEVCSREDCSGCQSEMTTDWEDIHHEMSTFGLGIIGVAVAFGPLVAAIALVVACGIGAIHSRGEDFKSKSASERLWKALADRGRQSAGMAWIDADCIREDGTLAQYWHLKRPIASGGLVKGMKRLVKPSTWWAMFHTRFATHGEINAENAHPHFSSCNTVALVHNGVISNHEQCWTVLEAMGRKQTEAHAPDVDSQVLAEMLAVGGIEMVIKHAQGTMSLIWADTRDAVGTLHFWTNGENPLHFGRLDNPAGDIMVASTESLWLRGAGGRAITEPRRVIKTRKVTVQPKSKWAKPYIRTEQVKDSRGKPVYTTKPVATHNWAAVIGKHYSITPDGKIDGVMTKHWEDTTFGRMFNWQDYAAGPSKASKPLKATGEQDVCSLPTTTAVKHRATDKDVHSTIYDIMDTHGGWPSFIGEAGGDMHGYCGRLHQGITPEGKRYDLSHITQPWLDDIDRMELLNGEFYEPKDWAADAADMSVLWPASD